MKNRRLSHRTADFLDEIRERYNLESDNQTAQFLDVTRSCVSSLRLKKTFLDDGHAVEVADLLDYPPLYVVACVNAERAHRNDPNGPLYNFWVEVARGVRAGRIPGHSVGKKRGKVKGHNAPDRPDYILCKIDQNMKKAGYSGPYLQKLKGHFVRGSNPRAISGHPPGLSCVVRPWVDNIAPRLLSVNRHLTRTTIDHKLPALIKTGDI